MSQVANTSTEPSSMDAQAVGLKLDTLVAKELPLEALLAAPVDVIDRLAVLFVKKGEKLDKAKADHKEAHKAFGKIAFALEIRLENGKKLNVIRQNLSLSEFIKDITGEKPPTHALTLKNAFGSFVGSKLIAEKDYDLNSNNCLELGQKIVMAVGGVLTHDAVQKAAVELKERGDKEAANLREILASVKPATKLDAKEALEMFQQICDDGHLVVCLADLPDQFAELSESEQKDTYLAFTRALQKIDGAIGDKVDAWTQEEVEREQGVQITAAGKPVGRVQPETETATEDEVTFETAAA
jgi:hypothetical protein